MNLGANHEVQQEPAVHLKRDAKCHIAISADHAASSLGITDRDVLLMTSAIKDVDSGSN